MFLRTCVLAAIATMATVMAACRPITFIVSVSPEFTHAKTTLEVNSYYSGYTRPQRFGQWSQSEDGGPSSFYSYKLVSYNSDKDEFLIKLVIMDPRKEYEFTGANKRPDHSTWEYWHCIEVDYAYLARSNRSNRPRNSTVSSPQRQNPPNASITPGPASITPGPRNPTFLEG